MKKTTGKLTCPHCERVFAEHLLLDRPDKANRRRISIKSAYVLHVRKCGAPPVKLICEKCERTVSQLHRKMCANCYKKWRRDNFKPNRTCDYCGKPFHLTQTNKGRTHYFCTRLCFRRWKEKGERRECEICGTKFYAVIQQIEKGMGRFCSTRCGGVGRRQDPEVSGTNPIIAWRQSAGFRRLTGQILSSPGAHCVDCRTTKSLVSHHLINPDPDRNVDLLMDPENLLVLCRSCHMKRHNPKRVADDEQLAGHLWRQHVGWGAYRRRVFRAKGVKCKECGNGRDEAVLTIHHLKDPNPTRDRALLFEPKNQIILCRGCHAKETFHRQRT